MSGSFLWLNVAQFLGALNDNLFQLLMTFFVMDLRVFPTAERALAVAGAVFVVPFLLFSPLAGALADRFSKGDIVRWMKVLEIVVMVMGLWAFAAGSAWGIFAALFLMSLQSALFSPSKYGIIPEIVPPDRLSRANGALTLFTYVAIIAGAAAAPAVALAARNHYALAQWTCVAIALLGAAASFGVRRTPAAGARGRVSAFAFADAVRALRALRGRRYLLAAVYASAYFSLIGAYMKFNIIPYGQTHLGLSKEHSSYIFFLAAIGIGIGAVLAGRLSGRHIEFGIVPIGAFGLTLFSAALAALPLRLGIVLPCVFGAGVSAGLFLVPVDAFVQRESPPERRGEVLAANNVLGWTGVLIAAGLLAGLDLLGLRPRDGFLLLALLTLALTLVTLRILPDFLLRFVVLVLTRVPYRLRVRGSEHIPIAGGALLVCNHVSYVDAPLLIATQQRRLRFIMSRATYERRRWLRPLLDLMGVIPIHENDPPRRLVAALQAARRALDEGYLVVIFPEGELTRTGNLRAFRPGFERIVRGTSHPIIPVHLGGAYGSIASFYHGRLVRRWPGLGRYPVTVHFGAPLPAESSAADVRRAVAELSAAWFDERKAARVPLGRRLVQCGRRGWGRPAVADTSGRALSRGRFLTAALLLRQRLRARLDLGESNVGVLLPPSVAGALANAALALDGRVPVNLNFTAAPDAQRSAVRQARLRHVITARAFVEKISPPELDAERLFVEDLLGGVGAGEKLRALFAALFAPAAALVPRQGFHADAVATILFSSGSTGEPKGVLLSHHNILSNIEALRMVFNSTPDDRLCAALPFFHSLGFTATLWYPLLSGMPVTYHPNPLDAAAIARVVREDRCTMLFVTPGFLRLYLRKAEPEDFRTLRYVITGAERLPPELAQAFEEKFGVRPLEGYGATELSPVATLSLPDVPTPWGGQIGGKPGSVGLPLPGIAVRIADPETGRTLPDGTPGELWIKGPNVMLGYLDRPDLTAEAIRDGWYRTGDIACVDPDGFVVLTDRLSRFSKIAGEMVPHGAVEQVLQRGLNRLDAVVAVTSVPDERRGERLAVLYTPEAGPVGELQRIVAESDLPNLWKPAPEDYLAVPALPLMGSGKLDLGRLKAMARGPGDPRTAAAKL